MFLCKSESVANFEKLFSPTDVQKSEEIKLKGCSTQKKIQLNLPSEWSKKVLGKELKKI